MKQESPGFICGVCQNNEEIQISAPLDGRYGECPCAAAGTSFQTFNPAPYIGDMTTKTDLPMSFIGNNKGTKIYGVKPKKPSLTAEKLGGHLTKMAVAIAAKNQTIKGSKDYKKVDKALIHLCEAIKELQS